MNKIIEFLEKKITQCEELGGMEKERWAFQQCLKEARKQDLLIHDVVGQSEQFICYKADIGNSRCSSQCRECGENECINK